jgi:hypothetical protein
MDGNDDTDVDGHEIMDGTPPDVVEHGLPGTESVDDGARCPESLSL